jgi:signal transduction histidine kinase/HAMP domain-containing protein
VRRVVGLQGWLVAAFVGVGILASLAVLLVVLPTLESSVRNEQAPREATALHERLLTIAAREPLSGVVDEQDVRELAASVRVEVGGEVRVLYQSPTTAFGTPDRVLIQAPRQAELITEFPPPVLGLDGRRVGEDAVWATAPLRDGDDVVGYVAAAAPLRGATAELAIVRRRVLAAVLAVLGLASLLGLALSHVIGSRIRRLADTASTLAHGDLSARAPATSPRELDTLSESLNGMAGRLESLVAEIRGERDRDRALLGSLSEGVLAVGSDGEVMVTNAAAERMLGVTRGDGPVGLEALPAPLREAVRAQAGAPDGAPLEREVTLPNGRELQLSVDRLGQERAAGTVVTLRDVTEERRLARARRDLVANVSHELKTPLAALKGFIELLEGEAVDPADRREFLGLMSQEADRLERLIEEQLQLARLDAGALPLELRDVDLGELASEATAPQAVLAEQAGVALEIDRAPAPVVARADPARVEQILVILLDNALRHTARGGRVTVAVRRAGTEGLLAVRDTGTGIKVADQPFVFDRFYRGDAAREGRSAGLGLAIARGLAEAHGGGLDLNSMPGLGSTFTLRLPLAEPGAPPAPVAEPLAEAGASPAAT